MKKVVMSTSSAAEEKKSEATEIVETQATAQQLQSMLDNICAEPEFALLRETLRLYRDEVKVH